MNEGLFHLNRPVHLARRNVLYKKAVEHLQRLPSIRTTKEKRLIAEQALFLFRESRRHAEAADHSETALESDGLFVKFLDTAVDNTHSVARMLRRVHSVETSDNPLDQFMGKAGTGIKMRGHYRRCITHVLKGLLYILEQAESPFEELCRIDLEKMSAADQARYEKARDHFGKLAESDAERAVNRIMKREPSVISRTYDAVP